MDRCLGKKDSKRCVRPKGHGGPHAYSSSDSSLRSEFDTPEPAPFFELNAHRFTPAYIVAMLNDWLADSRLDVRINVLHQPEDRYSMAHVALEGSEVGVRQALSFLDGVKAVYTALGNRLPKAREAILPWIQLPAIKADE